MKRQKFGANAPRAEKGSDEAKQKQRPLWVLVPIDYCGSNFRTVWMGARDGEAGDEEPWPIGLDMEV